MRTLLVLALFVTLALAGCASDEAGSPTPGGTTPSATPPGAAAPTPPASPSPVGDREHEVAIVAFKFTPFTLSVPVGASVAFANADTAPHTATANDSSWTTSRLATGEEEAVVFATEGTFPYHCAVHPSMAGVIVVGDGIGDTPAPTPTPEPSPTPSPSPSPSPTPVVPTPQPPVTPSPPPPTSAPTPPPAERSVEIRNFVFSPATLSVPAGTTIRWTNFDGAAHSATGDAGAFDTGLLDQGQSGTATFATPGTFGYFCKAHTSMRGTVTVT